MPSESISQRYAASARRRAAIGLAVAPRLDHATAVLVHVDDEGLDLRPRVVRAAACHFAVELADALQSLWRDAPTPPSSLCGLSTQLAEIEAGLVRELSVSPQFGQVAVLGLHDPGLWNSIDDIPQSRLSLSDPARVAEATGLTVVDDFPARDLAQGGRGGPIDALAQWIILRDPARCRALVDLGRTIRLTYLPPARWAQAAERVSAVDVGPGMELLDRLAFRLTGGKHRFDPGGTLAVQGRQIPELLQNLLAADCFHRPAPHWEPGGVSADWFMDESIRSALAAGWSMRDLLCTATHLVAESIARATSQRIPHTPPVAELILTGGGRQNGFLLREITRRLPLAPCIRLEELAIEPDHLEAACTAVLALLHLDQVPQTHTLITGAVTPRVLGRLTPGAPKHWRLVLGQIAQHSPAKLALRHAV